MFKRKVYETLLHWKKEEGGRTAALIQGARRVGKSTHASLDAFTAKFSRQIKKSYLIYTKDYRPTKEIDYVPFYMTQFL